MRSVAHRMSLAGAGFQSRACFEVAFDDSVEVNAHKDIPMGLTCHACCLTPALICLPWPARLAQRPYRLGTSRTA